MWRLERALSEIAGFDATTPLPAAGAHGGCRADDDSGLPRLPREPAQEGSHPGYRARHQPASSTLNGYQTVQLASDRRSACTETVRPRCRLVGTIFKTA